MTEGPDFPGRVREIHSHTSESELLVIRQDKKTSAYV